MKDVTLVQRSCC